MKFVFLLWMLDKLIKRAIRTSPDCARHVEGKLLTFQIRTVAGAGRQSQDQQREDDLFPNIPDASGLAIDFEFVYAREETHMADQRVVDPVSVRPAVGEGRRLPAPGIDADLESVDAHVASRGAGALSDRLAGADDGPVPAGAG